MQNGALYIRVSTEDQIEYSPDAQKRTLLEYAKKNDILISLDHIFIDEGISGRNAEKRPAFLRMIAAAKQKPKQFDVILVHKFDRFARSREDSVVYKSLLRKDCDVKVISITESIEDDKFSVILEAMLEAMAEYYSINLSEEVTKGMTEKALRGGYQSAPPLGYKSAGNGNPPVIVKEQAEIVRYIFGQYVHNKKELTTIARELNALGYRTQRNNVFEKRALNYIINNPFYIGKVRWNRSKHSAYKINAVEEIIVADGTHESIIDTDLFYEAVNRYNTEFQPLRRRGTTFCKHWLCGLLKCPICGTSLTYCSSQRRKPHLGNFQCYQYAKGKHPESCSIAQTKVEHYVMSVFNKIISDETFEFAYVCRPANTDALNALQNQLDKIQARATRIREAYEDGVYDLEDYKISKNKLKADENRIKKEIAESIKNQDEPATRERLLFNIRSVYSLIKSDADLDAKGAAMRSVCEEIVYDKDKKEFTMVLYVS